MKRLFKICYIPLLLLLLSSCADTVDLFNSDNTGLEEREGQEVAVYGSFTCPNLKSKSPESRGVTNEQRKEEPEIKSLYALVFDENDLLIEIVEAQPVSADATHPVVISKFTPRNASDPYYETPFRVILHASSKKRVVHFVANMEPGSANIQDEAAFVKKFTVADGVDAYWSRLDLTSGTAEEIGIHTNENGEVADATLKKFQKVILVRNYAKFSVTMPHLSDFEFEGYFVYNQPRNGTVAPFNVSVPYDPEEPTANRFANFVKSDDSNGIEPHTYSEMVNLPNDPEHPGQNYHGFESPDASVYTDDPVTDQDFADKMIAPNKDGSIKPTFLYEHAYHAQKTTNPFVIFRGKYKNGESSFYKAEFVYQDDDNTVKYFDILRNYEYKLVVTKVTGNGAKTVADAITGPAMNNFMTSQESQSLTNIAADVSRLYVNFTDEFFTEKKDVKLYVKNNYDLEDASKICNKRQSETNVTAPRKDANNNDVSTPIYIDCISAEGKGNVLDLSKGENGITWGNEITSGEYAGYREITLHLKDLPDTYQTEVVQVTNSDRLIRQVTLNYTKPLVFHVMPKLYYTQYDDNTYTASGEQDSKLPEGAQLEDAKIDIQIRVPAQLSKPRFPLTFNIESNQHNIYPDVQAANFVEMPVVVGSIIDNTEQGSYFFNRFITWDEFDAAPNENGYKTFHCFFKTYKEVPTTGYSIKVTASDQATGANYFEAGGKTVSY